LKNGDFKGAYPTLYAALFSWKKCRWNK